MQLPRNALTGQPQSLPSVAPIVTWTGISRTTYDFQLHPIGVHYKSRPGVYIFCRERSPGQWTALYIGEAENFDQRVGSQRASHHKWERVVAARATHICTLVVSGGKAARLAVETDLRRHNKPPLNDQ
jgi:hypothetical protein